MHFLRTVKAAAAALVGVVAGTASKQLLTDLPGAPEDVPFDQYTGYLELDSGENLFYWYVESQSEPSEDPIVLWLNGGPGCSSLGGFFTEHGPFIVRPDMTLEANRYAWNRKTNMVYLEQPAGVGFSDVFQSPDYYKDDVVAGKTKNFLEKFFAAYPELQGREFYITGESYGGMYIPFLSDLLVKDPIDNVNFRGFAIGNPLTDVAIDGSAYFDYFYSHALIPVEDYEALNEACGELHGSCMFGAECPEACVSAVATAMEDAAVDHLNPYYLYGDVCLLGNEEGAALQKKMSPRPTLPTEKRVEIGPCADEFTQTYLNLPEVQKAIGAAKPTNWTSCNEEINTAYTIPPSSLPKYENILNKGYKVLIYSGDADSVVNFLGTERWIGKAGLDLTVENKWAPWFGPDEQVAGFSQDYVEGLTFKTVKGAGHMVPAVRPLHGLSLYECFIFGESKCAAFDYPADVSEAETGAKSGLPRPSEPTVVPFLWLYVLLVVIAIDTVVVVAYVIFKIVRQRREGYQPINGNNV